MDTQTERAATRVALDNAAQVTNLARLGIQRDPSEGFIGVRNLISVRDSEGFIVFIQRGSKKTYAMSGPPRVLPSTTLHRSQTPHGERILD